MTKKGEYAKGEIIEWEGRPESFAVAYPYVMAFENTFIEIRHIETGALEQIILGNNIRRLFSNVDLNGNAVIQLVMQNPNNAEVRQIVKLIKAPPPPKTLLEPIEYQPKAAYVPTPKQQSSPATPSHLMSPALQPILSTNGSGPAMMASHAHPSSPIHQQHPQNRPCQQNPNPRVNTSGALPPIPQRPLNPAPPSYPQNPYSSSQPYPFVTLPPDENETTNGQDQQQYQGGHAVSWSSGGYP